ncbi:MULTISPECIES: hypothetical protein [Aliivibrio]|uniref:hypothetical protein n=1 Tax=Aliivibrio TaxID=511678 RepID=UPI0003A4D334|nr:MULTISPECIES: hypothetical protein [Aliivibrio]MBB1314381.1 hypothetical protein [Aliivibrio sp. SR45-2]
MAKPFSQDITVLFSAFDTKERSYNELSEEERYREIKKSWNALELLSKSHIGKNNKIQNNKNYLTPDFNDNSIHNKVSA